MFRRELSFPAIILVRLNGLYEIVILERKFRKKNRARKTVDFIGYLMRKIPAPNWLSLLWFRSEVMLLQTSTVGHAN